MSDVVAWGIGIEGKDFYRWIDKQKHRIVAYVDNNRIVWNKRIPDLGNLKVISPDKLLTINYDYLCICTEYIESVMEQCVAMGLDNVISGRLFAKDFSENSFLFRKDAIVEVIKNEVNATISRQIQEVNWRNIFKDTVAGYDWYTVNSLSLGRWAIGYQYAYVLSRVLNSIKPQNILECGMGQSTKIINSYISFFANTHADIVEQDADWIKFFGLENTLSDRVIIHHREAVPKKDGKNECLVYKGFDSVVKEKKYQLISIDGPWGGDGISRVDILECIPEILSDEFVILMDDYERIGEKNTVSEIMKRLHNSSIDAVKAVYRGEKDMVIITSLKLGFLLTM